MDKLKGSPKREALGGNYILTGGIVDELLSMSDEEIEAMLEGSKWGLYIRLDNGEIISSQEYRERAFPPTF